MRGGQEEGVRLGGLARSARAAPRAQEPARPRAGADAGQPPGRPRPARVVQVSGRRSDRQGAARPADADCHGRRRRDRDPGGHVLPQLADSRRRRAARHHRDAQARAGAGHAPAGALLRLDADRRAAVAHHERRRRHPEPGRHRPRAAGRRDLHRRARAWACCSTSTGG